MGIMMGADPGASAFPNDDNLFEWTATLSGSEDTAVSTIGSPQSGCFVRTRAYVSGYRREYIPC